MRVKKKARSRANSDDEVRNLNLILLSLTHCFVKNFSRASHMRVPQQLVPMTVHQADEVIQLVTQPLSQPFRQWLWMNYVLWNAKRLFVAQNMKRDMLKPCAVQNHNHGI